MATRLQSSSSAIARARAAGDPDAEADARRDHAAVRIEVTIDRALAVAPPLTPAQIKHISALLRAGGQRVTDATAPPVPTAQTGARK